MSAYACIDQRTERAQSGKRLLEGEWFPGGTQKEKRAAALWIGLLLVLGVGFAIVFQ
jgi:hypothetical protein